jgi:hypothetical protein
MRYNAAVKPAIQRNMSFRVEQETSMKQVVSRALKMNATYSSETPLTFNGLHGVISQKTEFVITTGVRTSNHISKPTIAHLVQARSFQFPTVARDTFRQAGGWVGRQSTSTEGGVRCGRQRVEGLASKRLHMQSARRVDK